MIESLFKALSAGLGLWQSKESRKYIDKLMRLEREYYEAKNKTDNEWDDAVLDNISFELQLLSKAFYSSTREPNSPNK